MKNTDIKIDDSGCESVVNYMRGPDTNIVRKVKVSLWIGEYWYRDFDKNVQPSDVVEFTTYKEVEYNIMRESLQRLGIYCRVVLKYKVEFL